MLGFLVLVDGHRLADGEPLREEAGVLRVGSGVCMEIMIRQNDGCNRQSSHATGRKKGEKVGILQSSVQWTCARLK